MLSLIQLLSLTSDIPSEPLAHPENSSHDNIQELSQHFISVADSIISEENTLKWQAIKEVAQNKQSSLSCFCFVVLLHKAEPSNVSKALDMQGPPVNLMTSSLSVRNKLLLACRINPTSLCLGAILMIAQVMPCVLECNRFSTGNKEMI